MIASPRYYRDSHRLDMLRGAVVFPVLFALAAAGGVALGRALVACGAGGLSLGVAACAGLAWGQGVGLGAAWARLRSTPGTAAVLLATSLLWLYGAAIGFVYFASAGGLLVVAPGPLGWLLSAMARPEVAVLGAKLTVGKSGWLWLGEAGVFLVAAAGQGLRRVRRGVYCEGCGRWTDQEIRLWCAPCDDVRHLRRSLEAEHYPSLYALGPGDSSHSPWTYLVIQDCSGCEELSYLTLELVTGSRGLARVFGLGRRVIVRRLVVPKVVYSELERRTFDEWARGGVELTGSGR